MKKYNDFEKLCRTLDDNSRADSDMDYVKLYLVNKISGNRDTFLKLKAECQSWDYMAYSSFVLSMCAIVFSIFSIVTDFLETMSNDNNMFNVKILENNAFEVSTQAGFSIENFFLFLFYLFIMGAGISYFVNLKRNIYIFKWQKYISVYLDEIDNNWNSYFSSVIK